MFRFRQPLRLFCQSLRQAFDMHDVSFVGAVGHLLERIERGHFKADAPPFDLGHFRVERYFKAHRRGRRVAEINLGAHRIVAGIEQRLDGIPRGRLEQPDQMRCPEHTRTSKPIKLLAMSSSTRRLISPLSPIGMRFILVLCYLDVVMSIPNVKRYRISSPDGSMTASLMAVLPKDVDVSKYLSDAAQRFDWKAYNEAQQKQFKIRVGQQKQKKAK